MSPFPINSLILNGVEIDFDTHIAPSKYSCLDCKMVKVVNGFILLVRYDLMYLTKVH